MSKILRGICGFTLILMLFAGCIGQDTLIFRNKSEDYLQLQISSDRISNFAQDTVFNWRGNNELVLPDNSTSFYVHEEFDGFDIRFKGRYIEFLILDGYKYADYFSKFTNHEEQHFNDSVKKNVPILYVFRATVDDLKKLNWAVEYPPTQMQNHLDSLRHHQLGK